jgi:hypothetical protein
MLGRSIKKNETFFVIKTYLRIVGIDCGVEWPDIDVIHGSGKPHGLAERV